MFLFLYLKAVGIETYRILEAAVSLHVQVPCVFTDQIRAMQQSSCVIFGKGPHLVLTWFAHSRLGTMYCAMVILLHSFESRDHGNGLKKGEALCKLL